MRKAVIDVGSNSVLLLVAEQRDGAWHPVYEDTAVTALGEGTKRTGVLGEPGMATTLSALQEMFLRARAHGAGSIRAAATMAVRIASNTPDFLARCEAQGTPVEVISGDEEARLGFESVANDPAFKDFHRLSIVDPGGHSTELLTAIRLPSPPGPLSPGEGEGGWHTEFRHSFPVGTLGLKTDVLTDESPGPQQILGAIDLIDELLGSKVNTADPGVVVVLGATGTNLISIREGLDTWQPDKVHGAYLLFEEISRAVGWLMPMTDEQRRQIKGMEPGREKTLPAGALILERFLHALRAEGCYVSVRGWRHAMLEL
jgi:exopolyphosphatase/guanosine-5'-triphosphate,3'-diphosphate pyrophosphatase